MKIVCSPLMGVTDTSKLYTPLKKNEIKEFPKLIEVMDVDSDDDDDD